MIYSVDERKVGDYFGEDLYEKTLVLSDFTIEGSQGYHEFGTDVNKIINIDGFVDLQQQGKYFFTAIGSLSSTFSNISVICFNGWDYTDDEDVASIYFDNKGYTVTDIVCKVQYTKRTTE